MKKSIKIGKVKKIIFVSGQIAKNLEADTTQQTREVLEKIKNILAEANASMDNVVKATVLLADINDFGKMNEVYQTFFEDNPPARAAFQVAALPLNAKIEIEAIAVLDD
jgi:2-iminobutanoate/2-iminopropanoate deaminase